MDPHPLAWARAGEHPCIDDVAQEPSSAATLHTRRLKAEHKAAEEGSNEPRPKETDVWPIVVRHNIRNTPDNPNAHLRLIQVAKSVCTPALFDFMFKIRAKLPALIDDIWTWEEIDDRMHQSELTREAALSEAMAKPCRCSGMWPRELYTSLGANGIDPVDLGHHMYQAIVKGRSETTPVIVLAGRKGGEGKSLVLFPLPSVFGQEFVQPCPAKGTFPLLGIEDKKIALLDEWRFQPSVLPLGTQLLWMEGKPVPVPRPQGQNGVYGHGLYTGSAPIFVTTPLNRIVQMEKQVAEAEANGESSEMSMILRRIRVYRFSHPINKPVDQIPQCPSCFASFLYEAEAAWSQRMPFRGV